MIEPLLQAERLLVHGLVDQAEEMFSRVAEQDPRNAIAVVGLARVALERGDDRRAYERACAALEIDPENAAALRLEARLSEVFATRGEPVERPPWLDSGQPPVPPAAPQVADPAPSPEARERASERHALTNNPSMADHRRRTEEPDRPTAPAPAPAEQPRPERPGFLRRLLGR